MPASARFEDWLWVGFCGVLVAFILLRGLAGIFGTIHRLEEPGVGVSGFLGALLMLGALGIIAVSYYDYSRVGSWPNALVIAALLTTPVYLVGEVLLQIDRTRKRNPASSDGA